jgi:hypothetical protein
VLRIGEELGLTRAAVERALAETGVTPPAEDGFLARRVGRGRAAVSRYIPRPATEVRGELERYLQECEYLAVQRRLAERTIYERQSGWIRDVKATLWPPRGRFPLAKAESVEVSVLPAGSGAVVGLVADLSRQRRDAATGGVVGGSVSTAVGAIALGTLVAPLAVLAALPAAPLIWAATTSEYRRLAGRATLKLEWILDRLEHDEPLVPASGPIRRLLRGNR